jgi:uncharacterized protein YndB with AHSA1/START domain
MSGLFVDKTIEINAPAAKVWHALTGRKQTSVWAREFSSGGPEFHLESDWNLGSPVLWKSEGDEVVVEGNVMAREPTRLLRFTAFDTRSPRPPVSLEDGITYELTEEGHKTVLHLRQGDFAAMENGASYRDQSDAIWERVLPKVKELAEAA